MASGDVYKLDLLSTWTIDQVVPMRNTFFYQLVNAVSGVAQRCFEAFEEDVLPELIALAPIHVTFDRIDVVNVGTPTDFYTDFIGGVAGDRETDPASTGSPSWLCVQLVGNRAGPGTRNARKRFSFLYEGDVIGNQTTVAFDLLAELSALETALEGGIAFASIAFNPVVVAHPVTLGTAPTVRFPITSYSAARKLSTQNTRKT